MFKIRSFLDDKILPGTTMRIYKADVIKVYHTCMGMGEMLDVTYSLVMTMAAVMGASVCAEGPAGSWGLVYSLPLRWPSIEHNRMQFINIRNWPRYMCGTDSSSIESPRWTASLIL